MFYMRFKFDRKINAFNYWFIKHFSKWTKRNTEKTVQVRIERAYAKVVNDERIKISQMT